MSAKTTLKGPRQRKRIQILSGEMEKEEEEEEKVGIRTVNKEKFLKNKNIFWCGLSVIRK